MYSYLEEVRGQLSYLVETLVFKADRMNCNIRIGVIAHGDYCDFQTSYTIKFLPLLDAADQANVDKIVRFVAEVGLTSGGDGPECYELALKTARNKMNWTKGSSRVLVMVGDSMPHEVGYTCNGYTNRIDWREELRALTADGVRIYAVQAVGLSGSDAFWQALAQVSGGRCLQISKAAVLSDLVMAAACREMGDEAYNELGRELLAYGRMCGQLAMVYAEIRTVTVTKRVALAHTALVAGLLVNVASPSLRLACAYRLSTCYLTASTHVSCKATPAP